MKISSFNHGIDSVQQGFQSIPIDGYPSQKELPPDGQAVTEHVRLLYPASKTEQLLDNFAQPEEGAGILNEPAVSGQVFDKLIDSLSRGKEGSASQTAYLLLQNQQRDLSYLLASLQNLVHA